ncbi:odorant receptor 13a isoform X2 [Solenopsis invicta]|uniref:odorant receptor 13a isoform X2 n=1 Tax=Solenopsis invicta TaxID=13686 RepID=UPI00193D305E|nr:odorant receptor 13a isoform X2 [Solenopsis invicta]
MPRVHLVQSSVEPVIANMENSQNERVVSSNASYQQNIRYIFKPGNWILGSIGIWPIYGIGRHASKIAIVLCNFALAFAIIPCVLHMIYDQKDLNIKLKLFGLLGFCTTAMMKYCVLVIRRPKIMRCIEHVKNDWWQAQASPIYEIVYLAHCVCGYTMYSVTTGSCGLAAIFATHVCGQIEVIISRLEDLSHGKNFEQLPNVNQRIALIVKSHVRILRFSAAVEEILQEVCLLEFASSIFTMCLPEYYCIVDWQESDTVGLTTYFLLFVSFCFNMYILCYIGEQLVAKSSQIGTRCFMIRWYQLPAKSMRSLILVIAMSSHPIKISAGRMIDLSLATFGNVLKTSLAYLSLLRTLVV